MMQPRLTKYRKYQGRLNRGHTPSSNLLTLTHGTYGLQAMASGQITARTLEAVRRVLTRRCKRVGRIWISVFPDRVVTRKPAEVRMGKGKGAPSFWVAGVRAGQVLFEMDGMPAHVARSAAASAAHKLPLPVRYVTVEPCHGG